LPRIAALCRVRPSTPPVGAAPAPLTGRGDFPKLPLPLLEVEGLNMAIKEGDKLPDATMHVMKDGRPTPVTTEELFGGKKVVLFAVPGAYTPTCSEAHLPGFVTNADKIRQKGIDNIVCVSVNDAFVMHSWGADRNAEEITMVADGNGEFTSKLGLEMDASGFGLGTRSQRYAMVVEDGVVKKLAVEEPGKFEVSKAESILASL
jgi:glutaredoxin/glutathione-dependent peroxiredoxin